MTTHEHVWKLTCEWTLYYSDLAPEVLSLDECACCAMRGRVAVGNERQEHVIEAPIPGRRDLGIERQMASLIGSWAFGLAIRRRSR